MKIVSPDVADELGLPKSDDTPLDCDLRDVYNAVAWWINHHANGLDPDSIAEWHIALDIEAPQSKIILTQRGCYFNPIGPHEVIVKYVWLRTMSGHVKFFDPVRKQVVNYPNKIKPSMTLAEFTDVNWSASEDATDNSSLYYECITEVEHTVRQNFNCSKKEAQEYAESFTKSLQAEGRLTAEFVASEPFYWKALHDFTQ